METEPEAERRLVAMLSALGHRVVPVPSIAEAVDLTRRLRFEVVFCPARPPADQWVEFFREVRHRIGAIVLVTDGDDDDIALAFHGEALTLPRDFSVGFGAEVEQQAEAFNQLRMVLILALVLVYAVMASQYESLRDPFIIMFSIPVAAIGVVGGLLLTNTSFSMQAYIGVIMLAGIVVSNAILLVDYVNTLRRRDKMPIREAVEVGHDGVTDTVIAMIDVDKEQDIDGRTFRMRRLTLEPGATVPWHSHAERPAIIYIISGVFGAIIGSFLNVVIHRVPNEESIVFPNSRCPSCGATIAFGVERWFCADGSPGPSAAEK